MCDVPGILHKSEADVILPAVALRNKSTKVKINVHTQAAVNKYMRGHAEVVADPDLVALCAECLFQSINLSAQM